MTVKLKNNAVGYLSAAISSSDSSATLTTGGGASFPSLGAGEYFYATLTATSGVYEIVKVTSRSTDAISITRAQEGTTALAFPSGSIVELRVTAQAITDAIADQIDTFATAYFADAGNGTSVGLNVGPGKKLNASNGTILLPASASPAQTAEGEIIWNSNTDLLTVGTGSGKKTMVDIDTPQTLTNKILTAPTISSIANGGTVTIPSATDTLVGRNTTDTLFNKTLASPTTTGTLNAAAITTSGNVSVGGTLNVTGSTTLAANGLNVGSGQLQVSGGNVSASGNISITGTSTLTGNVTGAGSIRSSSATAGIGYSSGGAVTQATSKATGVTLNTICGQITMNNAALAAATIVSFTLTNSAIAANDILVLNHVSGGTAGAYTLNAQAAAGSASINVRNATAGSLSEAIVIGFAVIKAAIA